MSLTLYDMDGYFYDNPEKIYSVGDRDKGLVYDADGNCLAKGSVALSVDREECPGPSLFADVCGQVVAGLWLRVGQCGGVVVVLLVGAGLPLPVLPEVLFPARDAELLDEQARVLAVLVQGPAGGPGAQS
jgi:hypothetical protein